MQQCQWHIYRISPSRALVYEVSLTCFGLLGCWVVGLLGRSQLQLCLHTRCNCFGPGAGAAGSQFRALQIWFAGVPAMGVRVCEENNKLENRHHRISIRV